MCDVCSAWRAMTRWKRKQDGRTFNMCLCCQTDVVYGVKHIEDVKIEKSLHANGGTIFVAEERKEISDCIKIKGVKTKKRRIIVEENDDDDDGDSDDKMEEEENCEKEDGKDCTFGKDDIIMKEEKGEETWYISQVFSMHEITKGLIRCSSEGCKLVACCQWMCIQDPDRKWNGCKDCQRLEFCDVHEDWPLGEEKAAAAFVDKLLMQAIDKHSSKHCSKFS